MDGSSKHNDTFSLSNGYQEAATAMQSEVSIRSFTSSFLDLNTPPHTSTKFLRCDNMQHQSACRWEGTTQCPKDVDKGQRDHSRLKLSSYQYTPTRTINIPDVFHINLIVNGDICEKNVLVEAVEESDGNIVPFDYCNDQLVRLGQEKSHDREATGAQGHTESAIRTELSNCRCASLSSPSKCTVESVIEVVVQ